MDPIENTQQGPPGSGTVLAEVIGRATYKPGWHFRLYNGERPHEHLAGGTGLTFVIVIPNIMNSTDHTQQVGLSHYFIPPAAAWASEQWERWVLECIMQVECHEAMEFFKVDGWAPFFPPHGEQNGHSPYNLIRRERAKTEA